MRKEHPYDALADRLRARPDVQKGHIDVSGIVQAGMLAASSHNTQPWKFIAGDDYVCIQPDYARRCAVVDPDDSHLFKSLGCAAENMAQAVVSAGFAADVHFDEGRDCVRIGFGRHLNYQDCGNELYEAIFRRQCTKQPFDGTPLHSDELEQIRDLVAESEVPTLLLFSDEDRRRVASFVARGNAAQLSDEDFRNELCSWIRSNDDHALATRDGLAGRTLGAPSVPAWLFSLLSRFVISAEGQSRTDTCNIMSSAGIAVFVCSSESKAGWVAVGRAYERFALLTASMDVRTAFINQPIEVPSIRREFQEWLGINDGAASLMVRFGHGGLAPFSLRRPIEDVVIRDKLGGRPTVGPFGDGA